MSGFRGFHWNPPCCVTCPLALLPEFRGFFRPQWSVSKLNPRGKTMTINSTVHKESCGYNDNLRRDAVSFAIMCGNQKAAAKRFGVSVGSIHNWLCAFDFNNEYHSVKMQKRLEGVFSKSYKNGNRVYDDAFRLEVAHFANRYSVQHAKKKFKVTHNTIYKWLKAFNMANSYWNK